MEIKRLILEKAAEKIASHIICRLGEETRTDIETIVQESFRVYENLKGKKPEKRREILFFVRKEAERIRKKIENWNNGKL